MIVLIVWRKDYYIASCPGIDNYIAIYLLKYYHTDRQLYSQFSVKILLFNTCLGERLLYSQLSGDRQQYNRLSIDILPFNQLSGGKVTILPVLGDILLYSQFR